MAVKRPGSRSLALRWAMRALVLAGLPTTRTLTSRLALRESASPCGLKMPPLALEQVGALHAVLAGHGADEQGDVDVTEGDVGVVGLHHAGEQREGAVLELHGHALERAERRGDLEHLQDDRLVGAEHRPGGDPEEQRVADLAGSTGDSDANGGLESGHGPNLVTRDRAPKTRGAAVPEGDRRTVVERDALREHRRYSCMDLVSRNSSKPCVPYSRP